MSDLHFRVIRRGTFVARGGECELRIVELEWVRIPRSAWEDHAPRERDASALFRYRIDFSPPGKPGELAFSSLWFPNLASALGEAERAATGLRWAPER